MILFRLIQRPLIQAGQQIICPKSRSYKSQEIFSVVCWEWKGCLWRSFEKKHCTDSKQCLHLLKCICLTQKYTFQTHLSLFKYVLKKTLKSQGPSNDAHRYNIIDSPLCPHSWHQLGTLSSSVLCFPLGALIQRHIASSKCPRRNWIPGWVHQQF